MKHHTEIKTFADRCREHPDHKQGMITERMLKDRLHEEIEELREHVERLSDIRCKTHDFAPHGYLHDASDRAGRYVCECEHWQEPKPDMNMLEQERVEKRAEKRMASGRWEEMSMEKMVRDHNILVQRYIKLEENYENLLQLIYIKEQRSLTRRKAHE